jgi:hypothetical protein
MFAFATAALLPINRCFEASKFPALLMLVTATLMIPSPLFA